MFSMSSLLNPAGLISNSYIGFWHRIQKALDRMETAQSTHGQSPYDYVTDDQSGRRIHSLELVTSLPLWPMRQEATRS